MKISENWLRKLTGLSATREELIARLTMAGIEVSNVELLSKDTSLELEITPNRGDCFSALGLSRELAAIFHLTAPVIDIPTIHSTNTEKLSIEIAQPNACPRYCGCVITGLNNQAQLPSWLRERLEASQINAISPIVDLCNYVMMELGQPLHAFALDKIKQKIIVRYAKAGETLQLLNGNTVNLNEKTLIIADATQPIAIAGIMGGMNSAVESTTTTIFLESAFFSPSVLGGVARTYGLSTDASQRFERGVDPALARQALARVTQLLIDICGGKASPVVEVCTEKFLPAAPVIKLREARVKNILGIHIPTKEIERILQALQLTIKAHEKEQWQLQAPSYRFDLQTEIDVIEEIARLFGYEHIPSLLPKLTQSMAKLNEEQRYKNTIKKQLIARGYREAITYSFVAPHLNQAIQPQVKEVRLTNPISSEMSALRTSLWASLLGVLKYNCDRQSERLRLFEIGRRFSLEPYHEEEVIAGLAFGNLFPTQWQEKNRPTDFYDVKNDLMSLFRLNNASWEMKPAEHSALHPGQSAALMFNGQICGYVGVLHPQLKQDFELAFAPVMFEISMAALTSHQQPGFHEISKFPQVTRDLAFILPVAVNAKEISATLQNAGGALLDSLEFFDVYQGKNIKTGHKSIAIRLKFHCLEHTLTDEEVNASVAHMVAQMEGQWQALLRDF